MKKLKIFAILAKNLMISLISVLNIVCPNVLYHVTCYAYTASGIKVIVYQINNCKLIMSHLTRVTSSLYFIIPLQRFDASQQWLNGTILKILCLYVFFTCHDISLPKLLLLHLHFFLLIYFISNFFSPYLSPYIS